MILKNKKKVLVAMSGGVDSSAVAFLLQKKGFEVSGIYMRLGDEYQDSELSARRVCDKLGIKLYPVNIAAKFKKEVIKYFVDSYKNGLTPNPCVRCNKLIKFGELLRWREKLGMDYLATGHYIRSIYNKKTKEIELYKALDKEKDQSYFLYNLGQKELKHTLFPLGDRYKHDLKKLMLTNEIPVQKKESMDICFLYRNGALIDQSEYIKRSIDLEPGPIVLVKKVGKNGVREKEQIGEHKGLPLYTIGQRRGVEVGGTGPFYVAAMSYPQNILYVVNDFNDELLMSREIKSTDNNFVSDKDLTMPLLCQAVIRYRHKASEVTLSYLNSKNNDNKLNAGLKKAPLISSFVLKQRAVTLGQSIVWYDGEKMLGGGVISDKNVSDNDEFML